MRGKIINKMVKCLCKCCHKEFEGNVECNVFTISRSSNFSKAFFMPIDLFKSPLNYAIRQEILIEKIREANSKFVTQQVRFKDITTAWEFVKENKQEGLVIRNNYEWYKVKLLQEAKVKIKEWEQGKDKGTFILVDDNRISGTSMDFVRQFLKARQEDKEAIAEIEFPFITNEGHYFQPRLRQIEIK